MIFYYTGAASLDASQNLEYLSLGGFKSNTPIPNSKETSIFDEISFLGLKEGRDSTLCIMLKNETENSKNNILFWLEYPSDSECEYEVAFVLPNSLGQVELIESQFATPYNASFVSCLGEINKINIGNLEKNEIIALWIKRKIKNDLNNYSIESIKNRFKEKNKDSLGNLDLSKLEEISIKMDWDD